MLHKIRAHARRILRTSSDIIEKLPKKDDSTFSTVVKVVSLADTAYEYFFGLDNPALEYLAQFDLVEHTNRQFVALFFSSLIQRDFKITNIPVSNDQRVIRAEVPGNGTLYFPEWTYEGGEKSDAFYHTPGFNFKKLLSSIWDAYNGRIYISIPGEYWDRSKGASFTEFPMPKDEVYGGAKVFLKQMIRKDLQYRVDSIPRCFLFVGEPGTGKSTFAMHMTSYSERVLKFNASGLHSISADNLNFLLDGLEPEYVIIDDIDRVMLSSSLATLLSILDMVKETHPDTVIILTANDPEELDRALKRPGRIDEIIPFPAQSAADRREILVGYMDVYNSSLDDSQLKQIISKTKGFTAAYMKEIAIQAKYLSFEDMLKYIANVKKYTFGEEHDGKEKNKSKGKSLSKGKKYKKDKS